MKKMRRSLVAAVLSTVCVIMAGCGKKADFDVETLGHDLATKITYADTLAPMGTQMAGMFLNLSDISITKGAVYEGSGGTAEEIVVFECATEEDAKKAREIRANVPAEAEANINMKKVEMIAQGRLQKFLKESTLVEQQYIMSDSKELVKDVLSKNNVTIVDFKRITLNEE